MKVMEGARMPAQKAAQRLLFKITVQNYNRALSIALLFSHATLDTCSVQNNIERLCSKGFQNSQRVGGGVTYSCAVRLRNCTIASVNKVDVIAEEKCWSTNDSRKMEHIAKHFNQWRVFPEKIGRKNYESFFRLLQNSSVAVFVVQEWLNYKVYLTAYLSWKALSDCLCLWTPSWTLNTSPVSFVVLIITGLGEKN